MNPYHLKRIFKNASQTFIKLNQDNSYDQRSANITEPLDRVEMGKDKREKAFHEEFCLRSVQVEFFANHGKKLDDDNREYIAKPILDGLVSLGLAKTDENIKPKVTQRMDESNPNI